MAGDPVGGSAPSFSVWPSSNLGSLHPIDTARRQEEDGDPACPIWRISCLFPNQHKKQQKTALSLAESLPERGQTRAN